MSSYKRDLSKPQGNNGNVLQETVDKLAERDLTLDDIIYFGTDDGTAFVQPDRIVDVLNVDYDSWYGSVAVPTNLIINLNNGMILRRWDSDGAEGWTWQVTRPLENAMAIYSIANSKIERQSIAQELC